VTGRAAIGKNEGSAAVGIGGEDGKWGLLRYTQVKTAYHHYG
jgi:lactaldehyde dehydrogenase/glycolaldehyde dehydrogenase